MYFDPKSSGARIKKLRAAHGLTQEQFSQHLNISDSHLRKMESGVSGGSIDLLVEIAEYFDVSLDYLVLGKTLSEEVMRKRINAAINILNACVNEY